MRVAPVRSTKDKASREPMKITAVITAPTPAKRDLVNVCAGTRIARHRGWPDKPPGYCSVRRSRNKFRSEVL
jgi:hypothetical protein